jgi:transcriptional regulator with XRE-family HTH domain
VDIGTVGRRVAYWRERRGMTQADFGALMGFSRRWVQDLEGGQRQSDPRLSVLERAAQVLSIPIEALLSDRGAAAGRECVDAAEAAALRDVIHRPVGIGGESAAGPGNVREVARNTAYGWDAFQASHYGAIGRLIPELVTCAHRYGAEASATLSMTYQLATAALLKFGDADTALLAADRGLAAASVSEEPLVTAGAVRRYADALLHLGNHGAAVDLATATAERLGADLERMGAAGLSVLGMLLLKAAMAAAGRGDAPGARSLLDGAASIAEQQGCDANHEWTAFGPTNVRLHRVAALVMLGEGATAVEAAARIDPGALAELPRERRAHLMIDLAVAQALAGRRDTSLLVLLSAERLAPQEVHCRERTRTLIAELAAAARPAPGTQLRELAGRCGLAL